VDHPRTNRDLRTSASQRPLACAPRRQGRCASAEAETACPRGFRRRPCAAPASSAAISGACVPPRGWSPGKDSTPVRELLLFAPVAREGAVARSALRVFVASRVDPCRRGTVPPDASVAFLCASFQSRRRCNLRARRACGARHSLQRSAMASTPSHLAQRHPQNQLGATRDVQDAKTLRPSGSPRNASGGRSTATAQQR
jgi:hypothetical protein